MTDFEATVMARDDYRDRAAHGLANLPPAVDAVLEMLPTPFVHALGVEFCQVQLTTNYIAARDKAGEARGLIRGYALGGGLTFDAGTILMDHITRLQESKR
ncbi:hypothetical protein [Metapseudomonas otitidis]|uniref:hypothetical protein n=1 Tax=Metapseudomonas otitidis TaxID=319939 RepID=UPI000D1B69F5|nr:hypothetical protein [Pseudomonas otitidis]